MRFCIEFHLKQKVYHFYYLLPCYILIAPHFHSYKAPSTFILKTFIVISHFNIFFLHTILLFMIAPEAHMNQAQTHYNPISLSLPWMFGFFSRKERNDKKMKTIFYRAIHYVWMCGEDSLFHLLSRFSCSKKKIKLNGRR